MIMSNGNKKLTRILSLDGSGIKGILSGQILVRLEAILQTKNKNNDARIADYFDLVAGTSTSGILACALICPNENGRPKFSARETVDIYLERGDEIFDVGFWQKINSAGGLLDEIYSADALEGALENYFGDTRLSDLLKPCLITAYDIRRSKAHFFTQQDAIKREAKNFLVKDLARCTSTAPTYFEISRIKSISNVPYPLIDGGVFANNPAMCAYAEARTIDFSKIGKAGYPTARQMAILSLGTGKKLKKYAYKEVKDWGKLQWIWPIIDILMAGNADTIDYQLNQIFDAVKAGNQYLRIDPLMGTASKEMDDARPENLTALKEAGQKTAKKFNKELEKFADLLSANA